MHSEIWSSVSLSSAQEVRGYVTTVVVTVAHICGLAQYINSDYGALLVVRQSCATEARRRDYSKLALRKWSNLTLFPIREGTGW